MVGWYLKDFLDFCTALGRGDVTRESSAAANGPDRDQVDSDDYAADRHILHCNLSRRSRRKVKKYEVSTIKLCHKECQGIATFIWNGITQLSRIWRRKTYEKAAQRNNSTGVGRTCSHPPGAAQRSRSAWARSRNWYFRFS